MHKYRFGRARFALLPVVLSTMLGQSVTAQAQEADDSSLLPIPRLEDGHVNFMAPPGEKGVWNRGDYRVLVGEAEREIALRDRGRDDRVDPSGLKPLFSDVPFKPWAEQVYYFRQEQEIEPYGRCKPTGGFRNMAVPYGTDIVQVPDQDVIYFFHTGGSHTFRAIYMDGRGHPEDIDPSYGGHSIGHWEGDTLVIDTVGFNERGWIDARGAPTTSQLHLVERVTRLDYDTLSYEMIVDDPGAYTDTWSTGMLMHWTPGEETFQFLCQDYNQADELMVGEGSSGIDRTSSIVP